MTQWNAIEKDLQPEVGTVVYPDGWANKGGDLRESSWDKADFRLNSATFTDESMAVNIKITGRTFQRPWGFNSPRAVRVRIEFVGDGEPSSFSGAWMIIN
jgi:hypothetical protein